MEVLVAHKDRLVALADRLIAEETIEAEEFEKLFADLPNPRQEPGGSPTPKPLEVAVATHKAPSEEGAGGTVPKPSPQPA
jgi:hypothetical protein